MGGLKLSGKTLWILWTVFLGSNSILAYSHWPPSIKFPVFGLGILLPLIVFSWKAPHVKEKMVTERESFPDIRKAWIWGLLACLALFLRFYKLTNFHLWPTGDESLHGFLAIDLYLRPRWQFFYTVGQHPPLLIWGLSVLFRFFDSPFFNLWFLPAVFSALAVPAGFWAARLFFSSSFSLIFTVLLAFSFWPLYFGRFCHQGVFIPFWELSCLLLLGYALRSRRAGMRNGWLWALGFWTGLGSLTFTSWLVVLAALSITVFYLFFRGSPGSLLSFGSGLGLSLLPFVACAIASGYGGHFIDVFGGHYSYPAAQRALTSISYLTSFFWGSFQGGTSYGPSWGGMLNPVLSASFLVGALELFLHRQKGFVRWACFFFLMGLLPGLLSADYVELNRVIQAMPFLLLGAAVGLQKLFLDMSPGGGRLVAVVSMCVSSCFLDLRHFAKPLKNAGYANLSISREVLDDNVRVYRILDSVRARLGPGLIFTDFLLLSHNHSLSMATYWFNGLLNPKVDAGQVRWASIVTNVHYQPYLAKQFPNSSWTWIDRDVPEEDGGLTVGIIPVDAGNRETLKRWMEAHAVFHNLSVQAENILNSEALYQRAESSLPENESLMEKDPFLESCYGEWIAQYHYGATYAKNVEAIRRAIQKGYPTAHLYYKLGNFLWANHQWKESRDAYRAASALKPNYTVAAESARYMDSLLSKEEAR